MLLIMIPSFKSVFDTTYLDSFHVAASTRVGNNLGAAKPELARVAAYVSPTLALCKYGIQYFIFNLLHFFFPNYLCHTSIIFVIIVITIFIILLVFLNQFLSFILFLFYQHQFFLRFH